MPVEQVRDDTVLDLASEPLGRVVVQGPRNTIRVGRDVVLNSTIWLQGSGTVLEIGDNCNLNGLIHVVRGEGGLIRIGAGTTFNAVGLSMHEAGEILIGRDCMFSTDIHLDVSDMHPIYDRATGQRINPARPIHIGDHVWVGTRVLITKGAVVGEGAVIGAGSIVVGQIPPHSLAAGTPARVIREDIDWRREFEPSIPAVAPAGAGGGWLGRLARLRVRARLRRSRGAA